MGDIAVVCGKDEHGLHILRRRSEDGPIEAALAQPLTEGRPIRGEVISMRQREDVPFVFDVKTELETGDSAGHAEGAETKDGPAQVATNSYRAGWDAIWGSPRGARGPAN
jgi:hypothetical protein